MYKKVYRRYKLVAGEYFMPFAPAYFAVIKTYAMQTEYTMSEDLHYELQRFLNNHDISLLNQNLRRLLVDFLDYGLKTGVPLYFDHFFYPFNSLLDVLEIAAQELQKHATNEKAEQPAVYKLMPIEKVVAFVKASLNPAAIFLLHHEVNEVRQDLFDLLVIIPATSNTRFTYYEQLLTLASMEDVIVHASLHKEEMLQAQLQQGHIYYSIACNKNNLLYASSDFKFAKPGTGALKALAEKATAEFDSAYKKANCFLNGAIDYRAENNREMTAFMLQQGVELTLRGLITALSGSCTKTHCLSELKKPLKRCVPEILYLFSPDVPEENRLLALLEKAYLESRYSSSPLEISKTDMELLTKGAEALYERAAVLFAGKIEVISRQLIET